MMYRFCVQLFLETHIAISLDSFSIKETNFNIVTIMKISIDKKVMIFHPYLSKSAIHYSSLCNVISVNSFSCT